MDTVVVKVENGKKINSLGQELIDCRLYGNPTSMLGTKLCDRCWELEHRIQGDPELARKILQRMENKNNGN